MDVGFGSAWLNWVGLRGTAPRFAKLSQAGVLTSDSRYATLGVSRQRNSGHAGIYWTRPIAVFARFNEINHKADVKQ